MREDGEQDTVHAGFVLEGAHGPSPSPDFADASFDGVGGSYLATLLLGFVAEAGEQFVEVVAQACNRIGVALPRSDRRTDERPRARQVDCGHA